MGSPFDHGQIVKDWKRPVLLTVWSPLLIFYNSKRPTMLMISWQCLLQNVPQRSPTSTRAFHVKARSHPSVRSRACHVIYICVVYYTVTWPVATRCDPMWFVATRCDLLRPVGIAWTADPFSSIKLFYKIIILLHKVSNDVILSLSRSRNDYYVY